MNAQMGSAGAHQSVLLDTALFLVIALLVVLSSERQCNCNLNHYEVPSSTDHEYPKSGIRTLPQGKTPKNEASAGD